MKVIIKNKKSGLNIFNTIVREVVNKQLLLCKGEGAAAPPIRVHQVNMELFITPAVKHRKLARKQ